MPRRIVQIELGLCFLIMFGTATVAEDDMAFDLSEPAVQQVALQRRPVGTGRYGVTDPYPLSPRRVRRMQTQQPMYFPQSAYPQAGSAEFGYPETGYAGPGYAEPESPQSGYLPPGASPSGHPDSGDSESADRSSGYPQPGSPPPGYWPPVSPQFGYPQTPYPQAGYPPSAYSAYPEFAYPGGAYPPMEYPESGPPAFAAVPESGGGLFDWRPQPPHFERPSRTYSLFRSNASYGWRYTERCAPTPWKPRGDGIPRRTSCYRMDYAPYELEHDSSKHGPAFYKRHELYPCVECPSHAYHLQRFYGPRH